MTSLYVCYQSAFEPLTQTQVVAYLEGLAKAGHRVILLTFEPARPSSAAEGAKKQQLSALGIDWQWRRYHKRFSLAATSWDVLVGNIIAFNIARREHVDVIHVRGHIAGVMSILTKKLRGTRMLFDVRGLLAEEYADAGIWKHHGMMFRIVKRAERMLLRNADAMVVLTDRGADMLRNEYAGDFATKPHRVIPCCVDTRDAGIRNVQSRHDPNTLIYVGKLGGWYWDDALVQFVAAARRQDPAVKLRVLTQSDSTRLRARLAAADVTDNVEITRVSPAEIPGELAQADAGLSFILPTVSKIASSPTKVGEYLAAGLPVVANAGVGDLDALLSDRSGAAGGPIGVIVSGDSPASYDAAWLELKRLLRDPGVHSRCRTAATTLLDLELVGWARYRSLYDAMAAHK